MKKDNNAAKVAVKADANTLETSHIKSGHKWLAWVLGATAIWVLVTFIFGLLDENAVPRNIKFVHVWYVINMGIFAVLAGYSAFSIFKKSPSQIFWSSTVMFGLLLQSVSLVILHLYHQDTESINGLAMLAWSAYWFWYMSVSSDVEADIPARYRNHPFVGNIVLYVMTASTVAYAFVMVLKLLW